MNAQKNVRNIKELAKWLNLSATTVSRVLNGKGEDFRISKSTQKRIFDAAREHNYSPNMIARGLKLEKTQTIGLIIPDIANPYFASIAKTIEVELRKRNYSLILCDSMDDCKLEKELLTLLINRKVDGILLTPVGFESNYIEEYQNRGMTIVLVDRCFHDKQIPYITTDNYEGGKMAAEYLISMGHQRIACIQGIRGISANNDRMKGFAEFLKNHNITLSEQLMPGNNFGADNGYESTKMLMSLNNPPTAIFTLGNYISLGAMRALKEIGLKVPQNVSLISFDEQVYSAFLATPMTTIEQQLDEISRIAVQVLYDSISDKTKSQNVSITVKPKLIIRESVQKNA